MKRTFSVILTISLLLSCLASPIFAADISTSDTTEYIVVNHPIEVDGILFNVSISPNTDGSKTITVVGNGETMSWSTLPDSEETQAPLAARRTGSYGSYRYIYNSSASNVWNLYRPLQDDGEAWAKGVSRDSGYCQSFADEVDSMVAADERISDYLEANDLIDGFVAEILLDAIGGEINYLITERDIPEIIAGAVVYILTEYVIPFVWEETIEALIDVEYYIIREAMVDANYYFELA